MSTIIRSSGIGAQTSTTPLYLYGVLLNLCHLRIIDRAFATTLAAFALGSLLGALVVGSSNVIQSLMTTIVHYRLVEPVKNATALGSPVVVLLIYANNSIPVILSFVYPVIVSKVAWTPPISRKTKTRLMVSFSVFCGFLIGFFNLGAVLSLAWSLGGVSLIGSLLAVSWLHGPAEFIFVLLSVSEPMRLVDKSRVHLDLMGGLRIDLKILLASLAGLLISALLEVFVHV